VAQTHLLRGILQDAHCFAWRHRLLTADSSYKNRVETKTRENAKFLGTINLPKNSLYFVSAKVMLKSPNTYISTKVFKMSLFSEK
jgi:hypothetical protein